MLLAVDIGNSNLTLGVFSGPHLVHALRAETRSSSTSEEYAVLLRGLCDLRGIRFSEIDDAIIASVVPLLTPVLERALHMAFGCDALVVGLDKATGITMRVDRLAEVGADRIVNAVAARELALREAGASRSDAVLERGAIIVDLGTATKLDCLSPRGEFLGGVIAPGVRISLDALIARGAKLRGVELVAPPRTLGRNTNECIQSGIVLGHAALVDGLIARLESELPFPVDVITTGGLASVITPHATRPSRLEPDLTLLGLRAIHAKNAADAVP